MRSAVTLGRYVAVNSQVHDLDPRAKLIAMGLYFFLILTIDSLYELAIIAVGSCGLMLLTRIPFSRFIRALRPLRYLIFFIFLFPILLGGHSLLINITEGTLAAGRMSMFILFTAILTFTTKTSDLTLGLELMLKPLRCFGVKPERWSLMLNLALRFIPTIIDEAKTILKAQASRGVDFSERSWLGKARVLITLLVPITVSTFRRSQDLTDSMESRGFVLGRPRTSYRRLVWTYRDTGFILIFAIVVALAVVWRLLG